jgi:hypothetical protein
MITNQQNQIQILLRTINERWTKFNFKNHPTFISSINNAKQLPRKYVDQSQSHD